MKWAALSLSCASFETDDCGGECVSWKALCM